MIKKMFPLFVVFALLAAYAGYRAQAAQAATLAASAVTSLDSAPAGYLAWAQALENGRTLPYTGPGLPASGFEYWQMHAGSASEITDHTNLSTGDIAHEQRYVKPDDCNLPRVRSPGARAAPVPSC